MDIAQIYQNVHDNQSMYTHMVQYLEAKPLLICHIGLDKQTFDDAALACRLGLIYRYMSKCPSLSLFLFFLQAKMAV